MSTISQPVGSVLINSINLITHAGAVLDIKHIFSSMEIYESIFTHSITAKIIISDSVGLISTIPIKGLETITIEYQTSKDFKPVKLQFVINKIQTIFGKDSSQVYTLELLSFDFFMNTGIRLSKKIKGSLEEIAKDLLEKQIKTNSTTVSLEDSANTIQFISNFYTPFDCIKIATAKAISSSEDLFSSFLFYQTTHGYTLGTIGKIFKQEPVMNYVVSDDKGRDVLDDGGSVINMGKVYGNVIDFRINSLMDYTKSTALKGLNVTTYHANPMRKKISKVGYDYSRDFDKTTHLGSEKFTDYSHMFPCIENDTVSTEVFDKYTHRNRDRVPLVTALNLVSIEIEAHGLSNLTCGNVVDFTLPAFSSVLNDISNDEMRSGRYIVSSICHKLNATSHKMTMNLMKDSLK